MSDRVDKDVRQLYATDELDTRTMFRLQALESRLKGSSPSNQRLFKARKVQVAKAYAAASNQAMASLHEFECCLDAVKTYLEKSPGLGLTDWLFDTEQLRSCRQAIIQIEAVAEKVYNCPIHVEDQLSFKRCYKRTLGQIPSDQPRILRDVSQSQITN